MTDNGDAYTLSIYDANDGKWRWPTDRLLDALRHVHKSPRFDIPTELLKSHKGYAGKYHRKPLERP